MAFTRRRTELVEEVFRDYDRYFSVMKKADKFKRRLLKDGVFAGLVESEQGKGPNNLSIELYLCTEYDLWINRAAYRVLDLLPEWAASVLLRLWMFGDYKTDGVTTLLAESMRKDDE